jgi:hypothetical protein
VNDELHKTFIVHRFSFIVVRSHVGSGAIFGGKRGARLTPSPRSLGRCRPRLLVSVFAC